MNTERTAKAMKTVLDESFGGDKSAMADACGRSVKSVYRWLSGEKAPHAEVLIRLAQEVESKSAAVDLAGATPLEIWQILEDY